MGKQNQEIDYPRHRAAALDALHARLAAKAAVVDLLRSSNVFRSSTLLEETMEERIAAKKQRDEAKAKRINEAQTLLVQWMRAHEAPEIRDIPDPDIFDMLRLLCEHVVMLETQVASLIEKKEEPRIVVAGG